jgi:hypothetical protein
MIPMICTHPCDSYGYPINVDSCPICKARSRYLNDAYTYAVSVGMPDPDRYMRCVAHAMDMRGYDETREAAEASQDYKRGTFNG